MPINEFLIQDSFYPIIHYNASQTDAVNTSYGTVDWVVEEEDVNFQPGGLGNPGQAFRRYSDGRELMIMSGPDFPTRYKVDHEIQFTTQAYLWGIPIVSNANLQHCIDKSWSIGENFVKID